MANIPNFDRIVQDLAAHPQHLRIRKLLWYLACHEWENDPHKLCEVDLQYLIQELWSQFNALSDLQNILTRIINGLNKKEEYAPVAHLLLNRLSPFYSPVQLPENGTNSPELEAEAELAQTLAIHPTAMRQKKLLLKICRDVWENDSAQLAQVDWRDLLQEVKVRAPTIQDLQLLLQNTVETLNKPVEYAEVAQNLMNGLQQLYPLSSKRSESALGNTDLAEAIAPDSTPNLTYPAFDVRQELMKYANPLRIKILLFSVLLHPFDLENPQDWSVIRTQTLILLLNQVCDRYPTRTDLIQQLHQMTQTLNSPEEYSRVLTALESVLQQYFPPVWGRILASVGR